VGDGGFMSKSEALPQLKQRRWREADARAVIFKVVVAPMVVTLLCSPPP
jgi:hypothetical protein